MKTLQLLKTEWEHDDTKEKAYRKSNNDMKENDNKKYNRKKIIGFRCVCIVCILGLCIFLFIHMKAKLLKPSLNYDKAIDLYSEGKYDEAIEIFNRNINYRNSYKMVMASKYEIACNFYTNKEYKKALEAFSEMKDFKDSKKKVEQIKQKLLDLESTKKIEGNLTPEQMNNNKESLEDTSSKVSTESDNVIADQLQFKRMLIIKPLLRVLNFRYV